MHWLLCTTFESSLKMQLGSIEKKSSPVISILSGGVWRTCSVFDTFVLTSVLRWIELQDYRFIDHV